jgi:hypothetical protein
VVLHFIEILDWSDYMCADVSLIVESL